MRIFVTGGTGLIGSRLVRALQQRGDAVVLLTRRPDAAKAVAGECEIVPGDPTRPGSWQDVVATCDAVVNLAGENLLGKRWRASFKDQLRESRIRSTEHCVQAIGK